MCGDGVPGTFICDDGNILSGDGCSASCTVEVGFTCPLFSGTCTEICDNVVEYYLPCDITAPFCVGCVV